MSDKTNRKELTARLDSELYEQLREATFNLRISKQQAITEALRMWLSSNSNIDARDPSPPKCHIPSEVLPIVNWIVRLWGCRGTPEQEGLKSSLKALAASETEPTGHSKSAS